MQIDFSLLFMVKKSKRILNKSNSNKLLKKMRKKLKQIKQKVIKLKMNRNLLLFKRKTFKTLAVILTILFQMIKYTKISTKIM